MIKLVYLVLNSFCFHKYVQCLTEKNEMKLALTLLNRKQTSTNISHTSILNYLGDKFELFNHYQIDEFFGDFTDFIVECIVEFLDINTVRYWPAQWSGG